MIGAEAGEVLAVVQTAMIADLPYTKLRDAVIAHPPYAESLDAGITERLAYAECVHRSRSTGDDHGDHA